MLNCSIFSRPKQICSFSSNKALLEYVNQGHQPSISDIRNSMSQRAKASTSVSTNCTGSDIGEIPTSCSWNNEMSHVATGPSRSPQSDSDEYADEGCFIGEEQIVGRSPAVRSSSSRLDSGIKQKVPDRSLIKVEAEPLEMTIYAESYQEDYGLF